MTVKIKTPLGEATCKGGEWKSHSPELQEFLELMMDAKFPHGVGPEIPDQDLYFANTAIEELGGGEIAEHEPVEYVPGRIY